MLTGAPLGSWVLRFVVGIAILLSWCCIARLSTTSQRLLTLCKHFALSEVVCLGSLFWGEIPKFWHVPAQSKTSEETWISHLGKALCLDSIGIGLVSGRQGDAMAQNWCAASRRRWPGSVETPLKPLQDQ